VSRLTVPAIATR